MHNYPLSIKVLFLHKSSLRAHTQKAPEMKWFSGLFSGHVGIEFQPGRVVDFVSYGRFRWFPDNKKPHSRFMIRTRREFASLFGTVPRAPHISVITIPVSENQQKALEGIIDAYTRQPPYDYAFLGMRCASATYELLARAGILRYRSLRFIALRIFTPGILKRYLRKIDR